MLTLLWVCAITLCLDVLINLHCTMPASASRLDACIMQEPVVKAAKILRAVLFLTAVEVH